MSDPKEYHAENDELNVEELEAAAGGDDANTNCTVNTNCATACFPADPPQ